MLHLHGGGGLNADAVETGRLGDLWRFDGSVWAWIGGTQVDGLASVHDRQGAFSSINSLGGRSGHAATTGGTRAYVFGGSGRDSNGRSGQLNDLWEFDGSRYAWLAGADQIPPGATMATGRWGSRGIPDAANTPSGRTRAIIWVDADGVVWLYGGSDYNDLWRYDPTRL
jgi:hypothetical protein